MTKQDAARMIVRDWYNNQEEGSSILGLFLDDVYVVWFSKTLQNWKALVAANVPDQLYFEVTYDGNKDAVYLDVYEKRENIVLPSVPPFWSSSPYRREE